MKERILNGWNFQRAIILLIGIFVIVDSINGRQWLMFLPGLYFTLMAVFRFGCAAGSCYMPVHKRIDPEISDIKDAQH